MPFKMFLICSVCDKEFFGYENRIFCSRSCSDKGRRKRESNIEVIIKNEIVYIPLDDNLFAKVDKSEYDSIEELKNIWHKRWCEETKSFYADRRINGKTVPMHRLIIGLKHGDRLVVNHKNFDTLDNRRENLETCSRLENIRYHRKYCRNNNPKSKYNGVTFSANQQRKPWRARITINDKRIHIGYFESEILAAQAWNEQAAIHFGKFAILNKI